MDMESKWTEGGSSHKRQVSKKAVQKNNICNFFMKMNISIQVENSFWVQFYSRSFVNLNAFLLILIYYCGKIALCVMIYIIFLGMGIYIAQRTH